MYQDSGVLVKTHKVPQKSQKITGEYKLHEHTLQKDTGQIIKQIYDCYSLRSPKTKISQKIQSKCI